MGGPRAALSGSSVQCWTRTCLSSGWHGQLDLPTSSHRQVRLVPCPALPCPALPCPALPCPALPCPAALCGWMLKMPPCSLMARLLS